MTRFKFGKNWLEYNALFNENRRKSSTIGILKLLQTDEIVGKTLLDIGSGSGLHALSFLDLGAAHVTCVDFDEESVMATKNSLNTHASSRQSWDAFPMDILNPSLQTSKEFEIVYSWGVLHHTGDLNRALKNASEMCLPEGLFVFALYRKTYLCWFWKLEKWFYVRSPRFVKRIIELTYSILYLISVLVRFRNPFKFVQTYSSQRGMDFSVDVRDWLGGYPYESISPKMVDQKLSSFGFSLHRRFVEPKSISFFGSGCDEFVYRKLPRPCK